MLLANVPPLMWNVLFVEPWTPGHAPVAREYQPAPVLGGASVRRPLPVAWAPFLRNDAIVGMRPWAAYFATRSWRMPSATKKTAVPFAGPLPGGGAAATRRRDELQQQGDDGKRRTNRRSTADLGPRGTSRTNRAHAVEGAAARGSGRARPPDRTATMMDRHDTRPSANC